MVEKIKFFLQLYYYDTIYVYVRNNFVHGMRHGSYEKPTLANSVHFQLYSHGGNYNLMYEILNG